ncbi:uncharacterized protein N7479_005633 [Penicillium vulpinum]|uniref:C2H2-type domain-containing protein n=1 Tax=Penicillium vulpinum TaxID=29845 RepID=A0A1V6SDH5_9EURO|nr:uncharacterized protein N7479_005633 [Penicillium vulpinum]KAJ5958483.1 hypothetical protein N7479_005633 [Penicillium vulpinum]OQE12051.1 hypothetical protein PENVUL_c001G09931 [Penicillium vulpinum]
MAQWRDEVPDCFQELDLNDTSSPMHPQTMYHQQLIPHWTPAVAEASMAPVSQPGYNAYGGLLSPLGEQFIPAFPSTHYPPDQNTTQYHAVNNNGYGALAAEFHGSAGYPSYAPSTMGSAFGQTPPLAGSPYSGVATPGAMTNDFSNVEMHYRPGHGDEQANPSTALRCDIPGCKYTGTFTVKGSLKRHQDEQHGSRRAFPCLIMGCNKGYVRKSHLADHQLKVHGIRTQG